jgi:DNA (cytosine-5)-methyltransferase 1
MGVDPSEETYPTLTVGSGLGIPSPPAIAFHHTQTPISGGVSPALSKNANGMGVQSRSAVRRLTPVECERLQGWPDGWTLVEGPSLVDAPRWFEEGYEPNEAMPSPDNRRYAACGDGVTATVAEWLGRRLKMVGSRTQ